MTTVAPARITTWSLRVLAVSGPLTLLIVAGWAARVVLHERPFLMLMLFLLSLAVTVCATLGALFGVCHASISDAFTVGLRVGRTLPPMAAQAARQRRSLHAVE